MLEVLYWLHILHNFMNSGCLPPAVHRQVPSTRARRLHTPALARARSLPAGAPPCPACKEPGMQGAHCRSIADTGCLPPAVHRQVPSTRARHLHTPALARARSLPAGAPHLRGRKALPGMQGARHARCSLPQHRGHGLRRGLQRRRMRHRHRHRQRAGAAVAGRSGLGPTGRRRSAGRLPVRWRK